MALFLDFYLIKSLRNMYHFHSTSDLCNTFFVSQLESTVKVQPGLSTSLDCHAHLDGRIVLIFWLKIPLNKPPVCIASTQSLSDDVKMCKQFKNQSRVEATWNKKTFSLLFSSVEQTDIATYICGVHSYGYLLFGNGTKLILDEVADGEGHCMFKTSVLSRYIRELMRLNDETMFNLYLLFLKQNTDEINYAALKFGNKQRRTVQKRPDVTTKVIYGTVRHQEEL
uniref:Immunoglobulin domain-containing protein n=1 Tax=Astyanax mexicanus TaxID=7994 RepID=A0A3B1IMQ0_ASTMX